jgi:uncharacterized membrane protein YhhN
MTTNKNFKVATTLFIVVALLDILGIVLDKHYLRLFFKPLILPSLLLMYTLLVPLKNKWYVSALLLSFLGDVFLLFSGKLYFMLGLGAFLLAHVCFIKVVLQKMGKADLNKTLLSFIIFFAFLFCLLFVLKGHLGAMQIPVIVYGVIITSFGALSFTNYLKNKTKSALVLFVGALIFISSDSMLALNKFYTPKEFLNLMVMVTYIVAQYLIFRAMVLAEVKK